MAEIKDFFNKDWYVQKFNARPHFFVNGALPAACGMQKNYGKSYRFMVVIFNKDFTEAYFYKLGLEEVGKLVVDEYKKDRNFVSKNMKSCAKIFGKAVKTADVDLKPLSPKQLIDLYHEVQNLWEEYWSFGHVIEGFTVTTDSKIKHLLKDQIAEKEKLGKYFELLTSPSKPSFMNEEYADLLRIKRKMLVGQDYKADLEAHRKSYFWIQNNYKRSEALTAKFFEEELESITEERFKKPTDFKETKKAKEQLIKELHLSEELVLLLKITDELAYWQDVRKKEALIMIHYIERVLKEIAERTDIDVEYLRWFGPFEVTEERLKNFDQNEIEQRMANIGYFYDDKSYFVLMGEELGKAVPKLQVKNDEVGELRGMTASVGRAIGRVKVCMSEAQLSKVEKGDILVASMTRPEFLPAMKRAAGIITDEGGITCHAAIVARELGIPCIIGTKKATKLLKDGMLVELQANHGLVKVREE